MIAKLNKELSEAVNGRDQIEAIDPASGRLFVLTEKSVYELTQQQQVNAAIQRGWVALALPVFCSSTADRRTTILALSEVVCVPLALPVLTCRTVFLLESRLGCDSSPCGVLHQRRPSDYGNGRRD